MFRQRYYKETEDNLLEHRLIHLCENEIGYDTIKFWNVNHKSWIDCDNLTGYKIQKEVQVDGELIFYIYKGELKDGK